MKARLLVIVGLSFCVFCSAGWCAEESQIVQSPAGQAETQTDQSAPAPNPTPDSLPPTTTSPNVSDIIPQGVTNSTLKVFSGYQEVLKKCTTADSGIKKILSDPVNQEIVAMSKTSVGEMIMSVIFWKVLGIDALQIIFGFTCFVLIFFLAWWPSYMANHVFNKKVGENLPEEKVTEAAGPEVKKAQQSSKTRITNVNDSLVIHWGALIALIVLCCLIMFL